jgi:hypothetical protein
MTHDEPSLGAVSRRDFLTLGVAATAGLVVGRANATSLPQDAPPPLRRVWLRLLMNQVEEDLRAGKKLTDQERYMAGLTGVQFLYVDEENGDLIFEGPAEDKWQVREDGIVVGEKSGEPLLHLDDFAVAWRNAVGSSPPPSVSLEHRQDSIQRIQEFIRATPQPKTAAARADYLRRMQEAWGPQDAVTGGVPTNTRFNKVMVDADWEMKRISLGLSDVGVEKFPTYVDLAFEDWRRRLKAEGLNARRPEGGSRFWFYPAYKEFAHSEKLDAVEIPAEPVELLTETHFQNIAQGRQIAQEPSAAAKDFVEAFTTNYTAVARKNPLFAELHNLFDWVAVTRLIRLLDAPRRIGWDLGFLAKGYTVAELNVPATMPGQVALRHAEVKVAQGTASLVFPARGGVSIDVERSIESAGWRVDAGLAARSRTVRSGPPPRTRFWR